MADEVIAGGRPGSRVAGRRTLVWLTFELAQTALDAGQSLLEFGNTIFHTVAPGLRRGFKPGRAR